MKIMVFDVAAESGGALTILHQYYEKAEKDSGNDWVFVISTPQMLSNNKNIKVISYPWIKKSWFHRLFFDLMVAPNIIKKHNVDQILSLQNIMIPRTEVNQTIYMHQALPFVEYKFKLFEDPKLWIYQNIIGSMIKKSIKRAEKIIVQADWIADAVVKKTGVSPDKLIVERPNFDINVDRFYKDSNVSSKMFFYPAGAYKYKNHEVIINAVRKINKNLYEKIDIAFTLIGDENKEIIKLKEIVNSEKLPIRFVGPLDISKVYEYYSKATLIFPSYIETIGLPLLEAKLHNTPILASDCAFAHELLKDYPSVKFFQPFDAIRLSEIVIESVDNNVQPS